MHRCVKLSHLLYSRDWHTINQQYFTQKNKVYGRPKKMKRAVGVQ